MVERAARIELASSAWKAAALPLSYARVADGAGIEPAQPKGSRRISIALPYRSANHPCSRVQVAVAPKGDLNTDAPRPLSEPSPLPERGVTVHTEDIGNTFPPFWREVELPWKECSAWKNVDNLVRLTGVTHVLGTFCYLCLRYGPKCNWSAWVDLNHRSPASKAGRDGQAPLHAVIVGR